MRKLLRFVNINVNCEADYCVIFVFLIKEMIGVFLVSFVCKGTKWKSICFPVKEEKRPSKDVSKLITNKAINTVTKTTTTTDDKEVVIR